jgi:hypothetical protein
MTPELSAELAEDLIHRGFESPDLDFKKGFDDTTGAWMELAKDVYGLSNYGGGYLVLGVEDGTFVPVGLDVSFHKDTQDWADRISKWVTGRIDLSNFEYVTRIGGVDRKFPIIQVHGSVGSFVVPKVDGSYPDRAGKIQIAFRAGIVYTRVNTKTVPVSGDQYWGLFWALLQRTAQATGSQGTPLEVISALTRKTSPDAVEEKLWSNLFPVIELPDLINEAYTDYRTPSEIYKRVNSTYRKAGRNTPDIPSFFLANKKIFCFTPFEDYNPLSLCITKKGGRIATKDWILDKTKQPDLVKLLNYNLKDLCRKQGFFYDQRHDRFFMRNKGGPAPTITWKPYKRTSTRPLIYLKYNRDQTLSYCEHFAGRMRFIILGEGIYLLIEPIRVLTADGETPLDQYHNVRISTKESFHYHNNNYLYDMKLWLHILAGNGQELHLGREPNRIIISVLPVNAKANFGILEDQYTSEDFLDELKSEPFEYAISSEESEEDNPLTDTSLEE